MNAPSREVCLTIPADMAYAPVATLALSGLGMIAGLDVDLLGDLRTVVTEALDCLPAPLLAPTSFPPAWARRWPPTAMRPPARSKSGSVCARALPR